MRKMCLRVESQAARPWPFSQQQQQRAYRSRFLVAASSVERDVTEIMALHKFAHTSSSQRGEEKFESQRSAKGHSNTRINPKVYLVTRATGHVFRHCAHAGGEPCSTWRATASIEEPFHGLSLFFFSRRSFDEA